MRYRLFISKKSMGDFTLDPDTGLCTNNYMAKKSFSYTDIPLTTAPQSPIDHLDTVSFTASEFETEKWFDKGWTPIGRTESEFNIFVAEIIESLTASFTNLTSEYNSILGKKLDGGGNEVPDIQNCNVYIFQGYPTLADGSTSRVHHTYFICFKGNDSKALGVIERDLFIDPPYFRLQDYNESIENEVGLNDYVEWEDTWRIYNYFIF